MTEKREKEIEDIVSVLDDALLDLINVSGKGLNDIHTMVMIKHLAEAISKHYVRRDDVGIDVDKLCLLCIPSEFEQEFTAVAFQVQMGRVFHCRMSAMCNWFCRLSR